MWSAFVAASQEDKGDLIGAVKHLANVFFVWTRVYIHRPEADFCSAMLENLAEINVSVAAMKKGIGGIVKNVGVLVWTTEESAKTSQHTIQALVDIAVRLHTSLDQSNVTLQAA